MNFKIQSSYLGTDGALVFDNSFGKHELIAQKTIDGKLSIIDELKFKELKLKL